jgi:glucan phosphoethanolaminetransferase (alkaline phosphatase superfamily)
MVAVQWIVSVVFLLIAWSLAAGIARFYFNKVYLQVLLRMENYRWLGLLDVFLVLIPMVVSGIFMVLLMESLLYRFFPVLRATFFLNLRFYTCVIIYMFVFTMQVRMDTQHFYEKTKELRESGELERMLERAKQKLDRREAEAQELDKLLQQAEGEIDREEAEKTGKRKGRPASPH